MKNANAPAAKELSAMQRNALMQRAEAEIGRNPRNVAALLTIADLFCAEKSQASAMSVLLKALAIQKKNPAVLQRLVSLGNDMDNMAAARKYARKMIEIEPGNARNHQSLGLILETMGNPAEAIEAFKRADRLEPHQAQTLHDIGRCYGLQGEHEKAVDYFRKALEIDPHYALALYNYAVSRKFTRQEADDLVARSTQAAGQDGVRADPGVHANLHFGMGKVLDETGRHAEAFLQFEKANALRDPKRDTVPTGVFLNTMAAFSRETFIRFQGLGNGSDKPVFILGMPRSGTTLAESLCGGHSKIAAGDEQVFFGLYSSELGSHARAPDAYRKAVDQLSGPKLVELGNRYLAAMKYIAGDCVHFTDKLPHNFLNIGLISLIFPKAKIILCRRHPLDNCLSLYSNSMGVYHQQYKTDLTRLGLYFRQYCQLMDYWKEVLPGRFHEVFYEDLVANTENNARAMIAHLGLEWEDGVMQRSGSQRSVRTLSGWQVRQPIYQTSKGKWRNYDIQLAPVAEALGPYVGNYERELEALSPKRA